MKQLTEWPTYTPDKPTTEPNRMTNCTRTQSLPFNGDQHYEYKHHQQYSRAHAHTHTHTHSGV